MELLDAARQRPLRQAQAVRFGGLERPRGVRGGQQAALCALGEHGEAVVSFAAQQRACGVVQVLIRAQARVVGRDEVLAQRGGEQAACLGGGVADRGLNERQRGVERLKARRR